MDRLAEALDSRTTEDLIQLRRHLRGRFAAELVISGHPTGGTALGGSPVATHCPAGPQPRPTGAPFGADLDRFVQTWAHKHG
jgi:hypothetical protein